MLSKFLLFLGRLLMLLYFGGTMACIDF